MENTNMQNNDNLLLGIEISKTANKTEREVTITASNVSDTLDPGIFIQMAAISIDLLIQNVTFYAKDGSKLEGEAQVQEVMNLLRETVANNHAEGV